MHANVGKQFSSMGLDRLMGAIGGHMGALAASHRESPKDGIAPPIRGIFVRTENVAGEVIDAERNIIRAANGPVASIEANDGGAYLTFDADYPSLEALAIATGRPGYFATCLADGLWRPFGAFNGRPAFYWSADIERELTAD